MRKAAVIFSMAFLLTAGCSTIELAPNSEGQVIKGENLEIRYVGNHIQETIAPVGTNPGCVRTLFNVLVSIKNTGDQNLVIKYDDFRLVTDDDLTILPMTRDQFCRAMREPDCPSEQVRQEKLKRKNQEAYSVAKSMVNRKIEECINISRRIIDEEKGLVIEPGKARIAIHLIFSHNDFSKTYFYQHSFQVAYKDLTPFVLADKDFWEIQPDEPPPSTETDAQPEAEQSPEPEQSPEVPSAE